jgi:hypothetical protein
MERALAARSPYSQMIAQMPQTRTTRGDQPISSGDANGRMPVWFGGPVGLRAGDSGARIAPEPIDTRKRKESPATIDRTLSLMQCPTLWAFSRKTLRLTVAVDSA